MRWGNYTKFSCYLILLILINVAGTSLFYRLDLTGNKIYSISEASQGVVSTLSEPLTIKVFFTQNLPAPHNNTERYLHDLLEEYAIYGNKYFNYRFYNVSPDEGSSNQETRQNQELARSYGIYPVQIQAIEKDKIKFQKAYMGLVLIHGDMIERLPTITSIEGLEYRLTTAIQKLNNKISALLRLPEKIRVKLFMSSSLKIVAPLMGLKNLPEIPEKLKDIVEKLNDKTYGKLAFEYLDPTQDETLKTQLKKYSILNLKWPELSGGKIKPGQGAIGLVLEYNDKVVEIPLIRVLRIPFIGTRYELADMDNMEEIINENLESLIDINEDLGYLTSHGTLKISGILPPDIVGHQTQDALFTFQTLASQNYTIKNVNLKDGTLPDSLNCLVIARPTETFTDYDLFQIDQFLMRGKNLALFLDAFNEVMPDKQQALGYQRVPTYTKINTGLEKLLSHYGVRTKKSYVMDENCYTQSVPKRFGGGERPIYFAPLIKNQFINNDPGFMKNIKGLITMKISPLQLDTERIKENGLKAYSLFSSSEKSWEMSGRINLNPMAIRPPQSSDKLESMPLAYIIEGNFPSYFAEKPIPEKNSENDSEKSHQNKKTYNKANIDLSKIKGEGEFLSRGKPAKIFLVASSEMLKDNMLDEEGRSPNATFVMNVLDYLNNREAIAMMRGKKQRFNPLIDTGGGTKSFIKSLNIGGLPVLVVLFGILLWFRRHSRKKRIQMMFQK